MHVKSITLKKEKIEHKEDKLFYLTKRYDAKVLFYIGYAKNNKITICTHKRDFDLNLSPAY